MKIVFLGTAAGVPTTKRNLPAVLIQRDGEQLMFDAGEGVQKQLLLAKASLNKIAKIFITHMHGDHMLGLPGLLQTMALLSREKKLDIYGPQKIKEFLQGIKETVQFVLTFPVEIHEIERAGTVCSEEKYVVEAMKSKHVIPSYAYAYIEKPKPGRFHPEKAEALGMKEGPLWSKLQHGRKVRLANGKMVKPENVMDAPRPGRKIVYTGDTRPFQGLGRFAAEADMLIHDCTLGNELEERAMEYGHSTPDQAARTAKKANVRQLVLTHISQRYEKPQIWLKQVRKIFRNTIVAEDFLEIEVPILEQ